MSAPQDLPGREKPDSDDRQHPAVQGDLVGVAHGTDPVMAQDPQRIPAKTRCQRLTLHDRGTLAEAERHDVGDHQRGGHQSSQRHARGIAARSPRAARAHRFIDEPDKAEETVDRARVPRAEKGKRCGRRERDRALSFLLPHGFRDKSEHDRQQDHAVQPHDIARLREVILHKAVADRQRQRRRRRQPAAVSAGEKPAKSHGRRAELERRQDGQKQIHLLFGKQKDQEIKGGSEIIRKDAGHAGPQHIGEGGAGGVLTGQDVPVVGEQVQILHPRVRHGERIAPKGHDPLRREGRTKHDRRDDPGGRTMSC